jgi:hypothetical protein
MLEVVVRPRASVFANDAVALSYKVTTAFVVDFIVV